MILIAAADKNHAIGKDNKLLYDIPDDMAFFRQKTLGKVVVMGRETLLSFKNAQPLKDRKNIVLSRDKNLKIDGAAVCHDLPSLFREIAGYPIDGVFVIGGESVYLQLAPFCSAAYITEIDAIAAAPDKYLKGVYENPHFYLHSASETKEYNGIKYRFCEYINSAVVDFCE
ncbi:MAG: dihydrofolate reductase [Clostridiales bacterium]|jgi:dihydrofolate reductase|nr:dihydrofolate reductase [Clostridiales bacterium]